MQIANAETNGTLIISNWILEIKKLQSRLASAIILVDCVGCNR